MHVSQLRNSSRLVLYRLGLLCCFLLASIFACDATTSPKQKASTIDPLSSREYAYAFELENMQGELTSLRAYRGKLVLLNFWATWCAPCVAEMPALERIHQRYAERGFTVVSINTDPLRDKKKVMKFISDNQLSFPVLRDPQMESVSEYAINGFPESFFIATDGKLLRIMDPKTQTSSVRLIKEREWDTKPYWDLIDELLTAQ